MRMVAPRTGAPEVTVAEDQLEYKPLTVAVYRNPDDATDHAGVRFLLSRWRLSKEERQKVAHGEDIVIIHLTGDGPLQPLSVQVGVEGFEVDP